jgi:hypothetical protein
MYAVMFKNDKGIEQIVAIEFEEEKAFATMRNLFSMNTNIKSEQVYINEYSLNKVNQILDLSI